MKHVFIDSVVDLFRKHKQMEEAPKPTTEHATTYYTECPLCGHEPSNECGLCGGSGELVSAITDDDEDDIRVKQELKIK